MSLHNDYGCFCRLEVEIVGLKRGGNRKIGIVSLLINQPEAGPLIA